MSKFSTRRLRTNLHNLGQAVNVVTTGRWILLCVAVGIIAGISAWLFSGALRIVEHLTLTEWAHVPIPKAGGEAAAYSLPPGNPPISFVKNWLLILMPAIGGILSGFLVFTWAPSAEGHGTDAVIKAYHHDGGVIKPIVPVIKLIASAFTIGTGGSAGKEGPIAQITAGFSSFMSTRLNLTERERKILVMAGMGAGIGTIFKAPIGGAIFSSEVLYKKDMESEGLMASIIASIVGYSVYASITGWEPIFTFEPVHFEQPLQLPLYIVLALVVTLVGMSYTRIFYGTKSLFNKIGISKKIKPAIGGLIVGVIAFFFPAVVGSSYGYLQQALTGHLGITFMLLLAFLKIFATSLTIQSGGSGGVFAPSLVIGGLVGGAFGIGAQHLLPGMDISPESFVLVGMGSFFASVANVPLASTILITEMSASYGLIVPLLFASTVAYLGGQSWSLYSEQITNRLESTTHRGLFLDEVLQNVKVRNAYRPVENMPIIHLRDRVDDVMQAFTESETLVLPVQNQDEKLVGMVSLYDVRSLINQQVGDVIIAADIMYPAEVLTLNDPLSKAFEYFIKTGEPEIPVMKNNSSNEFIGTLSERGFLIAYERAMKK